MIKCAAAVFALNPVCFVPTGTRPLTVGTPSAPLPAIALSVSLDKLVYVQPFRRAALSLDPLPQQVNNRRHLHPLDLADPVGWVVELTMLKTAFSDFADQHACGDFNR